MRPPEGNHPGAEHHPPKEMNNRADLITTADPITLFQVSSFYDSRLYAILL